MDNLDLINQLMRYAVKQTLAGNDFWCEYMGHIHHLSIRGYVGKWSFHAEPIAHYTYDVNDLTKGKVDACIRHFEETLATD